jgi:hypothetical protein
MTNENELIRRGDAMDVCCGYWRDIRTRIMSIPAVAASQPADPVTTEIDLRAVMMDEIEKAASESPWVPKEYYMNDVISDCCAFLRGERKNDPRDAQIAALVEALEYYAVEALPWDYDDSLVARTALASLKGGA